MKYQNIYDYLRNNYTFVIDSSKYDKNTNFFIKLSSYCINDNIISPTDTCKTIGSFTLNNNFRLINEDILMLLAKYQLDNKAGIVKTPCSSLVATNTNFPQNKVLTINTPEYWDVFKITEAWQTENYTRNSIQTTLGGYSLVHHMYNTEKYETEFIKKINKENKTRFEQFVMLPSGLKFAWLLRELSWHPSNKLVLYDVSSFPISFAKEMIVDWDGKQPLHDWALEHPVAKGILIASGQVNEGTRLGAGPKEWDNMWQQEIEKWGGVENIESTMKKLKTAEENGNITWCTINIAHDFIGQDLIFKNLDSTPLVLWLSNIYDSSPIGGVNATDTENFYKPNSRFSLINKWYDTLKQKLPDKSIIIGSVPKNEGFISGEILE